MGQQGAPRLDRQDNFTKGDERFPRPRRTLPRMLHTQYSRANCIDSIRLIYNTILLKKLLQLIKKLTLIKV